MANNTAASASRIRMATLGDLVPGVAVGGLQPQAFDVTPLQIREGWRVLSSSDSYREFHPTSSDGVSCMDDRLDSPLRLAGGALSEALIYHRLYGGDRLSDVLFGLRRQAFYLKLHEDCKALEILLAVMHQLVNTDAGAYQLLKQLGTRVSIEDRTAIAKWAADFPQDFVDLDRSLGVIHEFEPVQGPHIAGYGSLIARPNCAFGAETMLEQRSGLKALVITLWAADYSAARMVEGQGQGAVSAQQAALVAKVFSLQVFLGLAAPGLVAGLAIDA